MVGYTDWIDKNANDLLRGNNRELVRRFEDDIRAFKERLDKDAQHIMLLTLEEAQSVIDDLLRSDGMSRVTTYAGNIKDAAGGTTNILKLFSYRDAGRIVFTLKGRGIKAIQYSYGGKMYVKITGYPSLRRILNGTRYGINHPKVLELGIGKAGLRAGLITGARFCIWFSACWRLIELIFRSDHDVAAFLGNITMDVAKVVVTIFSTEVIMGGVSIFSGFLPVSLVVPIWGGIVIVVMLGVGIVVGLDYLDKRYKLSEKLINCIRTGFKERQRIEDYNLRNSTPFTNSILRGFY
ncbi:hypothetical protein [Kluyvera intermedia]|jgi:hypothetical protein|uniref:Uncharacterized protein n=1 Tax=Kluyvera intermedia TaxID=61648 RepID=A0ABX6DN14_KLUIN|nr:hypothetical protein [Kluyvera intermedia]QGH28415.1 hypothetical protein GHC21_01490 [Kluyvera intermedia]QGH37397.1 hypothetical protein GHC38_01490 [Kluyvera intermedia]WQD30031.1 hypothetical protein U0026_01675 [Kluyvera intermedia]